MAKTHPHIDTPTREQLADLVAERSREIANTYLGLHALVLDVLPDLEFSVDEVDASIGYAAGQYGYNGWGMAALTPFTKWVSLTLLQGSRLDDPEGLLQGSAVMRHIKLSEAGQIEEYRPAISALLLEASRLNE